MPLLLLGGRTQPAEVLDEMASHEVQEHRRGTPWTRSWPPLLVDSVAAPKYKFLEDHVFLLHSWLS